MSENFNLFADNSFFPVVNDIQASASTLSNDLTAISNQTF